MNKKLQCPEVDLLFEGILSLQTVEECYAFFDDICTIHELKTFAQRMEVAKFLCEGKTYTEIGEKTGASTATISRVNRALHYGSDGYVIALDRLGIQRRGAEGLGETEAEIKTGTDSRDNIGGGDGGR